MITETLISNIRSYLTKMGFNSKSAYKVDTCNHLIMYENFFIEVGMLNNVYICFLYHRNNKYRFDMIQTGFLEDYKIHEIQELSRLASRFKDISVLKSVASYNFKSRDFFSNYFIKVN